MKAITSIIERLENGGDITPDERKVTAFMLKELMKRDTHENGLVNVQMSPQLYERYVMFAYTKNGTFKVELNNK